MNKKSPEDIGLVWSKSDGQYVIQTPQKAPYLDFRNAKTCPCPVCKQSRGESDES